jgi:hypothetical protein
MGILVRTALTAAALLAASVALHADQGAWGGQVGAVQPTGGSKQWVNSTAGPSLDIFETFPLTSDDFVRMRFGYWDTKSSTGFTQQIILPGSAAPGTFPASTTSELYGFSYGAEYLRNLPGRTFVFGGLGVTYLTADRSGTFDLTSAGYASANTSFSANNFVPYLTAGAGFRISRAVDLEVRWQTATLKAQNRNLDLSSAGFSQPGVAIVDKLTVSTLTIGLTVNF